MILREWQHLYWTADPKDDVLLNKVLIKISKEKIYLNNLRKEKRLLMDQLLH